MSEKYDPVTALREEVERFKATNTFTPMLVTGFYIQAGVVLNKLAELQKAFEIQRKNYLDLCNAVIGESGTFVGSPNPFELAKSNREEVVELRKQLKALHEDAAGEDI